MNVFCTQYKLFVLATAEELMPEFEKGNTSKFMSMVEITGLIFKAVSARINKNMVNTNIDYFVHTFVRTFNELQTLVGTHKRMCSIFVFIVFVRSCI